MSRALRTFLLGLLVTVGLALVLAFATPTHAWDKPKPCASPCASPCADPCPPPPTIPECPGIDYGMIEEKAKWGAAAALADVITCRRSPHGRVRCQFRRR